jgi:glutaredoxin 3
MAKIELHKKDPCPFCDRAINLLRSKGVEFEIIDYTERLHDLPHVKEKYGWKTVPIIIINGQVIGGYTDLKELDETGELDKLLR